jgi:hypothetical protein
LAARSSQQGYPEHVATSACLVAEEARLARAFRCALTVTLALPLSVISCSRDTAHTDADASTVDACVPTLKTVFFGTVDGAAECRATQHLACGLPENVHVLDGGCAIKPSDCRFVCPSYGAFNCQAADASCVGGRIVEGPISVSCDFCPGGIGRRPSNLSVPASRAGVGALAAYFERAAFLEAASVEAFLSLRNELAKFGAPDALVAATRRATADEAVHLRLTARLARRFGGRAPPSARSSRVAHAPLSLRELARENAVEGCVRETYGALVASHQARNASDSLVRSTMEIIAEDETRHAALSWAVFRWAADRLGRDARACEREREEARRNLQHGIEALRREIREPEPDLVHGAGLPTAVEQERLLFQLEARIWS